MVLWHWQKHQQQSYHAKKERKKKGKTQIVSIDGNSNRNSFSDSFCNSKQRKDAQIKASSLNGADGVNSDKVG